MGKDPMKIMLLHAPGPLVGGLGRRGHAIFSCNPIERHSTDVSASPEVEHLIQTLDFPGRKKLSTRAIRNVMDSIVRFQPDILHAFTPASLAWSVCATMGLKTAGLGPIPKIFSFRGITRPLRRFDPSEWITYLSPQVAMHACESQAVMNSMLESGIPSEKCRVTYNVVCDFGMTPSREQWRDRWGIGRETWVVGTVAHVRPVKGIDILLRALMRMNDQPEWRLVIVGKIDHDEVVRLAAHPQLDGRVVFQEHSDEAPAAMQAFDVFAMPSRSEGLCRALIEAMTVGVCPVVSDAGGMKELVRDHQDGIVVPVEDDERLHRALRFLFNNRQTQLQFAQSARERITTFCSPNVVVEKLESMYQTVMKRVRDPSGH
jgi:glycosyltransferase involved in cell wall biosynthesis